MFVRWWKSSPKSQRGLFLVNFLWPSSCLCLCSVGARETPQLQSTAKKKGKRSHECSFLLSESHWFQIISGLIWRRKWPDVYQNRKSFISFIDQSPASESKNQKKPPQNPTTIDFNFTPTPPSPSSVSSPTGPRSHSPVCRTPVPHFLPRRVGVWKDPRDWRGQRRVGVWKGIRK